MVSKPVSIQKVIDRVGNCVSRDDLHECGSAAQYSSIKELKDFRPRTAYVLLAQERWDGEQAKAGRQRMIVNFGVVTAVQNYRDARKGAETAEEIDPLIGTIRDALIGWVPEGLSGDREWGLIEGGVLDYDQNTLLWIDVYQTQHFIGGGCEQR